MNKAKVFYIILISFWPIFVIVILGYAESILINYSQRSYDLRLVHIVTVSAYLLIGAGFALIASMKEEFYKEKNILFAHSFAAFSTVILVVLYWIGPLLNLMAHIMISSPFKVLFLLGFETIILLKAIRSYKAGESSV